VAPPLCAPPPPRTCYSSLFPRFHSLIDRGRPLKKTCCSVAAKVVPFSFFFSGAQIPNFYLLFFFQRHSCRSRPRKRPYGRRAFFFFSILSPHQSPPCDLTKDRRSSPRCHPFHSQRNLSFPVFPPFFFELSWTRPRHDFLLFAPKPGRWLIMDNQNFSLRSFFFFFSFFFSAFLVSC